MLPARIFEFILGKAKCFPKTKMPPEAFISYPDQTLFRQTDGLRNGVGKIYLAQNADIRPQRQPASGPAGLFGIDLGELADLFVARQENHGDDPLSGAPADGGLADRKRLKQRGMGFLVGLGHDGEAVDVAPAVQFSRRAVFPGPRRGRPGRAALVRVGVFIKFALKAKRLVRPGQLENMVDLFKGAPVGLVQAGLVAGRGGNMHLLRHLVQPALLVAAGKADKRAPLGQLVQPGRCHRQAQRVPTGQHIADGADLYPLGLHGHVQQKLGRSAHLEAFAVQVVFREGDRVKAQLFGKPGQFDNLLKHGLPAVRMRGNRPQGLALLQRGRD